MNRDGKILATGSFSTFNGTASAGLAKLGTSGIFDGSFNVGAGFNDVSPTNLVRQGGGGLIVVGAEFYEYQGVSSVRMARIRPDGSCDSFFNPLDGANRSINKVAIQSNSRIIIGGTFYEYRNAPVLGLARLVSGGSFLAGSSIFDFDGDGKTDISIFRPSNGEWWINRSFSGQTAAFQFGNSSDKPVPADFTGDGKTDIAVWRPATGEWFILRSENFSFFSFPFGTSGDLPAPGDYDGDGKFDAAIFRPANSTWFVNRSAAGVLIQQFGLPTDRPVPNSFVP